MKKFKYLGMYFTPLRQFTPRENALGIGLPFRSVGISNYGGDLNNWVSAGWSHEAFYEKAKAAGAGELDVFLWRGKTVVPCSNELFELMEDSPLLRCYCENNRATYVSK